MNNKTDRCVPPQGAGWGMGGTGPLPVPVGDCHSVTHPFLSTPAMSFPPVYWGGRGRRQNRNTHLGSWCSFPILFIFCLFFFFLTKVKFYLLQSFPVITTKPAPSKRPNLLACSRSLCLFISSHDFAVSITLICPLDNSSLNISKRLFLREQ